MNCEICDVGINCTAGCGVFCVSGCSKCVAWCEPAEVSLPDGWAVLEDSAEVKLCTQEADPGRLHKALQTLVGAQLEWVETEAEREPGDIEFSGNVEDLLRHVGLRRGNGDYGSARSSA